MKSYLNLICVLALLSFGAPGLAGTCDILGSDDKTQHLKTALEYIKQTSMDSSYASSIIANAAGRPIRFAELMEIVSANNSLAPFRDTVAHLFFSLPNPKTDVSDGRLTEAEKNPQTAISYFEPLLREIKGGELQLFGTHFNALIILSRSYQQLGQFEKSVEVIETALLDRPAVNFKIQFHFLSAHAFIKIRKLSEGYGQIRDLIKLLTSNEDKMSLVTLILYNGPSHEGMLLARDTLKEMLTTETKQEFRQLLQDAVREVESKLRTFGH